MALIYLFPETDVVVGRKTSVWGASSAWEALDDPIGRLDTDDYVALQGEAQDGESQLALGLTPPPKLVSVNSVTLHYNVRRDFGDGHGLTVGFKIGDTAYYSPILATPHDWAWRQHGPLDKSPATAAPWTQAETENLQVTFEGWDDTLPLSSIFLAACYVVVDAVIVPRAVGPVRDRASRGMRFQGRHVARLTGAPLELAAWPAMSSIALSHFALPPAGASPRRRDRRLGLITSRSVDLDALRVTLGVTELRRVTAAEVDTCFSVEDEITPAGDGVLRLALGGRSFARASRTWVPSPIDRRIVVVLEDDEPLSADGYLAQAERRNAIDASSLVNGNSGLSLVGAGTNGSAIEHDADVLWFDSVVTTRSQRFTAGSPHTADLYEQFNGTASYPADTTVCVSVAHQDKTAAPLYFALQRGVDGKWWPGSNGPPWSSGVAWWPLPGSVGEWAWSLAARVQGGLATTYTLRLGIPTAGAVAGQVNWRAHAQVEAGKYPSVTPIVTNGGAYTREAAQLTFTNNHGARVWPIVHGSGQLRIRPLNWTDVDLAAGEERVLVDATLDTDHGDVMLYRQGAGFVFQRRFGGVAYEAVAASLVDQVREYSIGWRWTGPEGELGLEPFTMSVIVDGEHGTDVVAPGYMRPAPSSAVVRIGHAAGPAKVADVALLYRELTPVVLDDDELMDF